VKKLFPYLVLMILLAWPQLLLNNFAGVVIAWVFTGAIMAYFGSGKRLFVKGFVIELILALCILWIMVGDEVEWLTNVFENNGVAKIMVPILFVLINALNAGFCLLLGSSIVRLFKPVQKSKKQV